MESPPVTLELLRTVGKKLKSSLISPKASSPGMPQRQSGISQIPSDLPIDILHLFNPQDPPTDWKTNILILRQKAPHKHFMETKPSTKCLENAIKQRKAPDTTKFTIEQSTSTISSLPAMKPSLLIRLKGSLTPSDYLTVEKNSVLDAASAINKSIDKEVKKIVEAFEDAGLDSLGKPRSCKTSLSRLLTKLPGNTLSPNTGTSFNTHFSGRTTREPMGKLPSHNRHVFNRSARPIIGSIKSSAAKEIVSNEHQYSSDPSSKMYTVTATLNDITGLDLEEYPDNEYVYTGYPSMPKSINACADSETTIDSTVAQKKNLHKALPQIRGSTDKVQICDALVMGDVIRKRNVSLSEKKPGVQAREDITGLDSFVSWRRNNKEREGATVVTEALKIEDTSIKFFPTMLSELTANYSKDLVDNINKNC